MSVDGYRLRKELKAYTEYVTEIRVLSAVRIDGTKTADDYANKLQKDFSRIGELGIACREIVQGVIKPLLDPETALSREEADILLEFCRMLLDPPSGEELDLTLLFDVSKKLITEWKRLNDEDCYAEQLNIHVSVCYANINRSARVTVTKEITDYYQKEGLAAAKEACSYLCDKEKFLHLSNNGRTFILRAARFYSALYDTFYHTEQGNRERFRALDEAIALYEDPFYRDHVEAYPWELHICRCLEHMGQLTERGNRWGFSREQCAVICDRLKRLQEIHDNDPEELQSMLPEMHYRLIIVRNLYFAGMMKIQDYQQALLVLYDEFASEAYDMYSVQANLLIPAEYLATLHGICSNPETRASLKRIYHQVFNYVLGSVNMDAFNYLQEYLVAFMDVFVEIPGELSFEDLGLSFLAALHPPTYVHSMQVADLSRYLTGKLVDCKPELFFGEGSYSDPNAVKKDREQLMEYAYHCGLCHDFGKLTMIDSIFIYGRDLFDMEYAIIRLHTLMGAAMLSRYYSTEKYAHVAKEHHIWHDHKGGYPVKNIGLSIESEILEIADSLDAATDRIGRSYNKGKTLDEISAEIISQGGTRYAPDIAELLCDPDVKKEISYYLTEGRKKNYANAYFMLRKTQSEGEGVEKGYGANSAV